MNFKKEDLEWMFWFAVFCLAFLLILIGPKPFWPAGGGVILQ